jgi:hypothetical protein
MDASQVSETIASLQKAALNPPNDVEDKRAVFKAARKLMLSIETPHETTQRVFYGVWHKFRTVENITGSMLICYILGTLSISSHSRH